MTEITLFVNSIGSLAQKIISEEKTATLLGVSSRGIFLQIGTHWVVFISYEPIRGPLTLNINHAIPISVDKEQILAIKIGNGRIYFPKLNIEIRTGNAKEWLIPAHPQLVLNPAERNQRITAIVQEIVTQRGGVGLTPVLAEFLHIDFPGQSNQHALIDRSDIHHLYQLLRSSDEAHITAHLQKLIGLGFGLTPSGDDLIVGLLLTYNRYQEILDPPFSLSALNKAMVELAYQKTSLLSANLIDCASLGQADERLIQALDGMMTGATDVVSCTHLLINWGSSSGCDALVGMALVAYQT